MSSLWIKYICILSKKLELPLQRYILDYLYNWLNNEDRMPLVLRGARQVGKTWVARKLAEDSGRQLIELNFEKNPIYKTLFNTNDPKITMNNIESLHHSKANWSKSILFLDEIQAAPELLAKLRWFAEELPELAVIAVGSLLDIALEQYPYSIPVGRITYAHLEPLSFEEFLLASQKNTLVTYLVNYDLSENIPDAIHTQLMQLFKEYMLVGGLPKVVSTWVKSKSLNEVSRVQNDLLATYNDDFHKYAGKLSIDYLADTLQAIPKMVGEKFVFKRVNQDVKTTGLKKAVRLLNKARVSHSVKATSANGLPLGAEVNNRYFKQIFLDVGLLSSKLGLTLHDLNEISDIELVNIGGVAEQVAGQLLRINYPYYIEPALYYWLKEGRAGNAELDYLIQYNSNIIPIEVKSGSTGTLKSLHVFMALKGLKLAVRISGREPSLCDVESKLKSGDKVQYKLLSIPFYLINQLNNLLSKLPKNPAN